MKLPSRCQLSTELRAISSFDVFIVHPNAYLPNIISMKIFHLYIIYRSSEYIIRRNSANGFKWPRYTFDNIFERSDIQVPAKTL